MGWTRSRWPWAGMLVVAVFSGGLLTADAAEPEGSVFVPVDPVRVLDTRINVGLVGPLANGVSRSLKVTGMVPVVLPSGQPGSALVVPEGATGVIANVTAVSPTTAGFVSVRPGTATGEPTTSSINFTAGGVVAPNAVTVALPTSGALTGWVDLFFRGTQPGASTDLLVDIVGYFTVPSVEPETRTVTFTGRDLTDTGAFQTGTSNGCTVDLNARAGRLSLDVPVGATILNVTAVVYDESAASVYTVALRRVAVGAFGDTVTTLASADNAAENLLIQTAAKDLTPPATETVEDGERFEVDFDDGVASFGNGLCNVSLTYRMPANVAATSVDSSSTALGETTGDTAPIECDSAEACRVETP